jgi:hypothetical protein
MQAESNNADNSNASAAMNTERGRGSGSTTLDKCAHHAKEKTQPGVSVRTFEFAPRLCFC